MNPTPTFIGIDNLAKYAETTGIGKKTNIDLPGEASGLMPSTRWKLRVQHDKWYAGETISVAIGQGAVTVTPLQLATAIGGLATGGAWYQPRLVKAAAQPEPVRRGRWASPRACAPARICARRPRDERCPGSAAA